MFLEIQDALKRAEELVSSLRRLLDLSSPTTPQNVSAEANGQIATITWDEAQGAPSISHYRIYRNGSAVATDTASPYDDPNRPNGTYIYAVAAVDAQGREGTKATASAILVSVSPPAPGIPINFSATSISNTRLDLSWAPDPNLAVPTDYDVDFSTNGAGGPWTSLTVGNQTTFSHTGLTTNQLYTYRLRASVGGVFSAYAFTTGTPQTVGTTIFPTFHFGLDLTAKATWRTSDDVTNGWDWSYHPDTQPAELSGMFQFQAATGGHTEYPTTGYKWPQNFPGKKIYKVNFDWDEGEPTRTVNRDEVGVYTLSKLNLIQTVPSAWGGVQLDVRGAVYAQIGSASVENYDPGADNNTAPPWLRTGQSGWVYTGTKNTGDGGASGNRFRYYDIGDSDWSTPFRHFIRAIANYTIPNSGGLKVPAHPRLVSQIVHGQSGSVGEEAGFGSNPTAASGHVRTLEVWASAYGANASKLAWCGEGRDQGDNDLAIDAGLGSRGGIIENFLRSEYTPYISDGTSDTGFTKIGQGVEKYTNSAGVTASANYYLTIDDSFPIISSLRHFGDQNEFPKQSSLNNPGPEEIGSSPNRWNLGVTFATLRAVQMRRNLLAIELPGNFKNATGANAINGSEGFCNPENLKWASLQLGKRVDGLGGPNTPATEAWIALMQTYSRSHASGSLGNITIHNFEHFLTQREVNGETVLTNDEAWGWNPQGGNFAPNDTTYGEEFWRIKRARRIANNNGLTGIGLKVDDNFLTGHHGNAAIKVVYIDNNTQTWKIEYKNSSNVTQSVTNTNANTGSVRTRTFFLSNFACVAGNPVDIWLKGNTATSTATPFMFVRVILL